MVSPVVGNVIQSTHRGYFTNTIVGLVRNDLFPYRVLFSLPNAGELSKVRME